MYVFKFGGGVMKDVESIKKIAAILQQYMTQYPLIVVVSAIGKTTVALEKIVYARQHEKTYQPLLDTCYHFHLKILQALFVEDHCIFQALTQWKQGLYQTLKKKHTSWMSLYNIVIAYGESISSLILYHYLLKKNGDFQLCDSLTVIKTFPNTEQLDFILTSQKIKTFFTTKRSKHIITPGFISSDRQGMITNLGKEGSDYTAAIWATILKTKGIVLWKNVPGVMSDDPQKNAKAFLLPYITYDDLQSMIMYGGDKIVHKDALALLSKHRIPLFFKNFEDPYQIEQTVIMNEQTSYPFFRVQGPIYWLLVKTKVKKIVKDILHHVLTMHGMTLWSHLYFETSTNIQLAFSAVDDFTAVKKMLYHLSKDVTVEKVDQANVCISKNVSKKKISFFLKNKTVLWKHFSKGWTRIVFKENF